MPNKPKQSKPKKCKVCTGLFSPYKSTDQTCGRHICAVEWVKAKERKKEMKLFNAVTRKMKEAIKTKSQWMAEADKEFGKFTRVRDADLPCISCGRTNAMVEPTDGWKPGGAWDCGHYLSKGAHPELRYDEDNANKQCKSCNGGAGKYAKKNHTVTQNYRINLLLKIGTKAVEVLEGPHELKKYTVIDYKAIKAKYKMKAKDLLTRISEAEL